MRGSIVKRGRKSWAVVIPIGARRKWFSHKTRGEAEAHLAQILAQVQAGTWAPPAKMLLGDYLERWLRDEAAISVRPTTFASYREVVRTRLIPALGHVPLAALSAHAIQAFLASAMRPPEVTGEAVRRHLLARASRYERRGDAARAATFHAWAEVVDPAVKCLLTDAEVEQFEAPRAWRRRSSTTVRYYATVLHRALAQAVRRGLVARNAAAFVTRPRKAEREMAVWDDEQVRIFLAEARRTSQYYRLYLAALATGMRQGELLGLRWRDLDLALGRASVQQTFYRLGKQQLFKQPKTASGRRQVALAPVLVEELRRLREGQTETRSILGADYADYDLVFAQTDGKPLHAHNVVRRGLPRGRPTREGNVHQVPRPAALPRDPASRTGGPPESGERTARPQQDRGYARPLHARPAGDAGRGGSDVGGAPPGERRTGAPPG